MNAFNIFSLEGKIILVTGASSGIGKEIAIACSKMGASMVITGRNKVRLEDTISQMAGENNILIPADLCSLEQIHALVDKLPNLDGIVHCAGIGGRTLCRQIEERDIDTIMSINFKAPVMLQTALLKQKKINKRASIIFISSMAYKSPSIGNAIYSASKGAIISFANCLALELASRFIRVNCILPAMTWTDLVFKGGLTDEELKEDEKRYPLKRYGKPEDIANLSIYLLSDASSWMTGSCIDITGGANLL